MHKQKKIIFGLVSLILQQAFGQCPEYDSQPPRLNNVSIKSFVTQNSTTKIFIYSYSLSNGAASTGCIKGFEIDITAPQNGSELSKTDLVDYPRYIDKYALQIATTPRIIPIGIPKLPRFKGFSSAWSAGFSVWGSVSWHSALESYKLDSGAVIDSIIMTSHGLPGLRSYIVHPSYNPLPPVIITPANEDSVRKYVPEPTQEEEDAFQRLIDSIKVRGVTIGPTAPPANFVPFTFLDTLISYKHQAQNLGWVGEQEFIKQLDEKLDQAKDQLKKDHLKEARDKVDEFVKKLDNEAKKIEKDSDKKNDKKWLTSEGYALLKYNAEYLIQKLDEQLPKKK